MPAEIGTVLGKNVLWVAISSTTAASALFAGVMDREASHTVNVSQLEQAIDQLVVSTTQQIEAQEIASQAFVDAMATDLGRIEGSVDANRASIRSALGLAN